MKKIIKNLLVPVLGAIVLGYIGGKIVFKTYRDNVYSDLNSSRLYLIENGEYDNLFDMREENMHNNYVYYMDDNKYKTVIGITKKYRNIDKIRSLYSDDLKVYEYYVSKDELNALQDEYDKELADANDTYKVREVVDNILELYRKDDELRLIQVN